MSFKIVDALCVLSGLCSGLSFVCGQVLLPLYVYMCVCVSGCVWCAVLVSVGVFLFGARVVHVLWCVH